jgi:hypothetical protein
MYVPGDLNRLRLEPRSVMTNQVVHAHNDYKRPYFTYSEKPPGYI